MEYREIETIELVSGEKSKHILFVYDDGSMSSFPIGGNPHYLAWLETEDGKAYLASQKASK